MEAGIKGILTMKVEKEHSAGTVGSGNLEVFSTPSLVAFVEKACWMSIDEFLEEGQSSVGTRIDIKHLKATPIGMSVTCECEVTKVEGKRIEYNFVVRDELDEIATGMHERYIINSDKFLESVISKMKLADVETKKF